LLKGAVSILFIEGRVLYFLRCILFVEFLLEVIMDFLGNRTRQGKMREILFKNMTSLERRKRTLSISERSEDKDCQTHVKKSFIYLISARETIDEVLGAPVIYIRKSRSIKTQQEYFSFRIKGCFYLAKDQSFFKVRFCHCLKIHILWKTKQLSSPKPATLM